MTATSQASGEDLRLEVVAGKATGFAILVADQLIIGRHSEGPGRLADDPELSRQHAQISREQGGMYVIEDLASTNGTIVNGSRISSPTPLVVGDSIEVGATTIRVAQAPGASQAPPAVDVRAATVSVDVPAAMRSAPSAPDQSAPPTEPQQPPEPVVEEPPEAVVEEPPEAVVEEPPEAVVEEPTEALVEEPPEAVVEEPVAEPESPRLALGLVFDPQRAELEIWLDGAGEPIRLALDQGRWQVRTAD
jgi:hypothetical protein